MYIIVTQFLCPPFIFFEFGIWPSRPSNIVLINYVFCSLLGNTYNLGQKVLRILLFLTHRRPTLRMWHHGDPSPHPSLVNVV